MTSAQVLHGHDAVDFITNTRRPQLKSKSGRPLNFDPAKSVWDQALANNDAYVANSFLDKREWAILDREIVRMVQVRLNAVMHLRNLNLVRNTTLAEMVSQWRVASERTPANVRMSLRSQTNRDRTDKKVYGVPVPIISADYDIDRRELEASRRLGGDLDVTEAAEAAQSVAEKAEEIVFDGQSDIIVNGNAIQGYTTLTARTSDIVGNFNGGDFGTISNIYPTFLGMIGALALKRYHGPFNAYVSATQYNQMLEVYADGSGQTALERVRQIPQIQDVYASDFLSSATGEVVLVQMTPDVVRLIIGLELTNRQWEAPDGSALFFKVMMALAPRLVTNYESNAGIAHATGA